MKGFIFFLGVGVGFNIGGKEKLLLLLFVFCFELLWEEFVGFGLVCGDFRGNLGKIGVEKVLEFFFLGKELILIKLKLLFIVFIIIGVFIGWWKILEIWVMCLRIFLFFLFLIMWGWYLLIIIGKNLIFIFFGFKDIFKIVVL